MKSSFALSTLGILTLSIGLCGCDRPPQAVYPVRGVVQWTDGQPAKELAEASVELQIISGPEIRVSPRGEIQPDGSFVLKTYSPGDGAPMGKYRAIVMPKQSFDDEHRQVSIMDPRYQDYKATPLTVDVEANDNEVTLRVDRRTR